MNKLLRAIGRCRTDGPGLPTFTGTNKNGEAEVRHPIVIHAPGSWFFARPAVARVLTAQVLAVEDVPPDYLRPLIAAVVDAPTAPAAVAAALEAGIPVLMRGNGQILWKSIGSHEEIARLFEGEAVPRPIFALEQIAAAGRLRRFYAWRSGAIIEVPA